MVNIKRMIDKYSEESCIKAFDLSEQGWGARSVAEELNVHTNAADSMIDAGRALTSIYNSIPKNLSLIIVTSPIDSDSTHDINCN